MPLRILVVDDDPDLRGALAGVLGGDFEVREAESGERALDLIKTEILHLVLLDVSMPGLSGLDVLALSRALAPGLPVIMLTSHQDVELALEALSHGAVEYVTKPFDAGYIRAEVARLLAPPPPSDGRPWKVAA